MFVEDSHERISAYRAALEACGICGSTKPNPVSPGFRRKPQTLICRKCGAKWWDGWFTDKDWNAMLEANND